jgi:hypothetical protein
MHLLDVFGIVDPPVEHRHLFFQLHPIDFSDFFFFVFHRHVGVRLEAVQVQGYRPLFYSFFLPFVRQVFDDFVHFRGELLQFFVKNGLVLYFTFVCALFFPFDFSCLLFLIEVFFNSFEKWFVFNNLFRLDPLSFPLSFFFGFLLEHLSDSASCFLPSLHFLEFHLLLFKLIGHDFGLLFF